MFALALTLCLMAEGHPACRTENVYTNDCVGAVRALRANNPSDAKVTAMSCIRVSPEDLPEGHPYVSPPEPEDTSA